MFSSGWARGCYTPKNLLDYSFIIKGKVGRRRISLSFLSRCPASFSSSSRLSRGVFSPLNSQARSPNYHLCVCVQRACTGIVNLLSSLRRSHATIVLLFWVMSHASVAWFCFQSKLAWFYHKASLSDCDTKWLILLYESSKPTLFQNFSITFLSDH